MDDEQIHGLPQSPVSQPSMENDDVTADAHFITITISHRKQDLNYQFPEDATISDLLQEIEASLEIPVENQKIIVPKLPLIKAPLKDPNLSLQELQGKKLMLVGSTAATVENIQTIADKVAARNQARRERAARHKKHGRRPATSAVDSTHTFLQIKPLAGLPHPERSEALLRKLKADPGIRAVMKKHKFTVALLTEMEPLANTQSSHEGTTRLLGLNRNKGEVIELRLRTDAHDGYRDYKTIRKTLCHELAHNVHGPHDRQFWDLCHQIEREVEAADWKHGGHTLGDVSRYTVSGEDEDEDHEDDGGWTGGEFVLGGDRDVNAGLTRREILAKAAEERKRRQNMAEQQWKTRPKPSE